MRIRRVIATGFSAVELLVAIAVIGILMTVGIPGLVNWISNARVNALPEFYLEGLRRARDGAINYSCASRLVLTENAGNGQFDYQIDWCCPIAGTTCDDASGVWSTTATPRPAVRIPGQPPGPSIVGNASGLALTSAKAPSSNSTVDVVTDNGRTEVYFDSTGWLNTNVASNFTWILFVPGNTELLRQQVWIPLSGVAERCNPAAPANDSRFCPIP